MKTRYREFCACVVSLVLGCASARAANDKRIDPLEQLNKGFPQSVELKNNGRLLEFCPDGTCDGFVSSGNVPVATLKDFAYLYIYFFSDYTFLEDWRNAEDAKKAAEQILGNPEYSSCKNAGKRDAARCILQDLSRNGKVRLIFVRYDEGERNVVRKNLAEKLSVKDPVPKH